MKSMLQPALLALLVCACATSSDGPKDVTQLGDMDLCKAYGERGRDAQQARAEIARRKLFDDQDLASIDRRQVTLGRSECGVYAALPDSSADASAVENKGSGRVIGKDVTFTCRDVMILPYCPATRYEIRSGTVTAIVKTKEP